MQDAKWEFVHSQVLASSVMASLQRANVYAPGVTDDQRKQLRGELTAALRDIGSRYSETVAGSQHEKHILELVWRVSRHCETALANRRLRLGIAAKALNLYRQSASSDSSSSTLSFRPPRDDACLRTSK